MVLIPWVTGKTVALSPTDEIEIALIGLLSTSSLYVQLRA